MDVPCITIQTKKQGGNMDTNKITRIAIVSTLYVVLTVINPFSYETIQFRISEILMFLCLYKKEYVISLTIGCLISNFFSPMILYDIAFGTTATLLAGILMYKTKNIYISTIYPILTNTILVGIELSIVYNTPFLINAAWVLLGEAVIMIIGLIIFLSLRKKEIFKKMI